MSHPRRLLTIAHSYGVALNRRLAHELARAGAGRWEVTAAAPMFLHGDLRPVPLEPDPKDSPSRLEAVDLHGSKHLHLAWYGRRLRALLREPWDLVHAWEEPYIVMGGQIAWWTSRRTPLVYATFQNVSKQYPPPFCWIERYAMRRSAGWVAFGQTIKDALLPRPGYTDRPSRVISVGVDTQVFRPDPAARCQVHKALGWDLNGPPVVGYLGRFVLEKGLGLLMRALDNLRTAWRALFVGSGPMENELQQWAQRHGRRAHVLTSVKHDRVPAYLNAMDLLCAPSQTTARWREQLGRMILEAFACGVPVLASDSGEIPFVVGDAGRIVPEADEAAWGQAVAELLADRTRRAELAARGLQRARDVYDWPVVARQHLDFFEELLEPSNRLDLVPCA